MRRGGKRRPSPSARSAIRARVRQLRREGVSASDAIRRAVQDARRHGYKTR